MKCICKDVSPLIFIVIIDVGPAPEVARSTQAQNRTLYPDAIAYFCQHPTLNPGHVFYRGNCKRPYNIHDLTQAYYTSDRAVRMSGFDLSGRFGAKGQYAAYAIPISLNSFLYEMGKQLLTIAGMTQSELLLHRVVSAQFLKSFHKQINTVLRRANGTYSDKIIPGLLPTKSTAQLYIKQPYLYA